ncbi:Probable E3 ubiquitin-protein ligase sinah [Gryllus bimaculatus]|nr:Probable E3 ubiquitin-protein ligase sinah [Gryllus bimaculatus]
MAKITQLKEQLRKALECPVCSDTMERTTVRMCPNGHAFCNDCRAKMLQCPICRNPNINGRCIILEDIANFIHSPPLPVNVSCQTSFVQSLQGGCSRGEMLPVVGQPIENDGQVSAMRTTAHSSARRSLRGLEARVVLSRARPSRQTLEPDFHATTRRFVRQPVERNATAASGRLVRTRAERNPPATSGRSPRARVERNPPASSGRSPRARVERNPPASSGRSPRARVERNPPASSGRSPRARVERNPPASSGRSQRAQVERNSHSVTRRSVRPPVERYSPATVRSRVEHSSQTTSRRSARPTVRVGRGNGTVTSGSTIRSTVPEAQPVTASSSSESTPGGLVATEPPVTTSNTGLRLNAHSAVRTQRGTPRRSSRLLDVQVPRLPRRSARHASAVIAELYSQGFV